MILKKFVGLNAAVLGIPAVEICVLRMKEFDLKYGKSIAVYVPCDSPIKSGRIYMRDNCFDDVEDCFHNVAHEMRHHYQRIHRKDFFDKRQEYSLEIDAIAYARLMSYYFTLTCISGIKFTEFKECYKGKTIEDIEVDTEIRMDEIRRETIVGIIEISLMKDEHTLKGNHF